MYRTKVFLAFVALFVLSAYAQAQDPDLLGWWKFDDGTGTVAVDSSGNGHDGVFIQDPEWVAGKFGSGLHFDGKGGERVSLGGLDIPSGQMTITCWFKADNLDTPGQDPRMVSKANGGGNNDHWWMFSSSRQGGQKLLRFRLKTNDGQQTSEIKAGSFEVGEWIHGAIWWDGTDMKVYKNGEEVGTLAKGGTSVATDPSIQGAIGNQPIGAENRPFEGIIDDVRIYTRALSVGELGEVIAGPPAPLAAGPDPADGITIEQDWYNLAWQSGTWAVSHDVYFGTDFDAVNEGAEGTFVGNTTLNFQVVGFPGFPIPGGLQPGATYYWRVDEVNPDHPDSPWKGVVWSFSLPPKTAYNPFPPDGMKFVDTDVVLSWTAKWNAALYSVYFGTDPVEVENAAGATPNGKMTYDPGALELDTTYYWRVDAFDGVEWRTGNVWSFTTTKPGGGILGEYANYDGGVPIPPESPFNNVTLTRVDPGINFQWGNNSPEPGVINEDNFAVRWTGELEVPLDGRYTFKATTDDGVLLYVNGEEMADAWRNQGGPLEQSGTIDLMAGEFAFIKMLYFATSGSAVAELRWEHDFFPLDFIPAAALSPPLRAGSPNPANQAVDVSQTPVLKWVTGRFTAEHDIYLGTDADAVRSATKASPEFKVTQPLGDESYEPGKLALNTTYYWRVDEVNNLNPESPWIGNLWRFTTGDFLVVDDFESYTDNDAAGEAIWQTWVDGFGIADNGSQAGYLMPPYAELGIVHSGFQSMPILYNNVAGVSNSEVSLTLAALRDWTTDGVGVLSLWFRGDPANAADPLYVSIANAAGAPAVAANSDSNAAQSGIWTEWRVALQDFTDQGINLTNVDKIAIGVGSKGGAAPGGSGTIYIDDIRLYRP